jgi:transcriptional regulator with XRE-family HTH domain
MPSEDAPRAADQVVLGRAVRELRARRGLSPERLGEEAGMHRNYVGAIERGEINPTFRVLLKVTAGLNMPLSLLVRLYERRRDVP